MVTNILIHVDIFFRWSERIQSETQVTGWRLGTPSENKFSEGSQIETEILCSPEIVTALLLLCFLYKRTWGDPPVHLPPQILSLLLSRAIWEVSETSDQSHTAVVVYFQILLNIYTPLEKKKNPENSKRKKKLFHSRFILNGD